MGRMGLAAIATTLALVLSACASGEAGSGASPTPIDSERASRTFAGGPVGDATDPVTGPVFPLTLHRTGGIAGYDDTVVLQADGKVLVETRTIHGRVCTLTGAQQKQLLSLLSTLRLVDAPGPPPAGSPDATLGPPGDPGAGDDSPNDAIVINITDHKLRPLDLSDPSLGEVAGLVGALVADVTLSSPAATECSTPTTTAPDPAP
ncbi:hypothetical protein [Intrasporangium sp.]|uniref:hypothetical protein n=1 Tax=Intrasporangium sp. TaxID=1925024 RepID=UPI00293A72AA|nr:hypothetical protein [Intrasporangium sp.]MDV3220993.1 hypothetical protein [Intrasporangium sp.]